MLLYMSVCLRTRQDTISYSFMYIIQKAEFRWMALMSKGLGGSSEEVRWKFRRKFRRKFGGNSVEVRWKFRRKFGGNFGGWDVVFQAYYSPLLVLVCRSVSQDPPGQLKTLLLRSVFYTLRRQRSANQRSPMCTWHLADQSAIVSRRCSIGCSIVRLA